ncbi:hypothetical protein RB201_31475 [Streptomyces sp. S1A(2023)]
MLVAAALQPFETLIREPLDVDGQAAPHLVQHDAAQFLPQLRFGLPQRGADVFPVLGVGGDLRQVRVVDAQQPYLLQVGHRDPPTAFQVPEDTKGEHVAEGAQHSVALAELGLRVLGEVPEAEAEGVCHAVRNFVVLQ